MVLYLFSIQGLGFEIDRLHYRSFWSVFWVYMVHCTSRCIHTHYYSQQMHTVYAVQL